MDAIISQHHGVAFIREDFDAATVLHVFGEIDISNSKDFEEALTAADNASSDRLLVIDLTGCIFIDSTVLQVLIRAHQERGDRLCVIVPEASMIQRVFRITKLDSRIPMVGTLSEILK